METIYQQPTCVLKIKKKLKFVFKTMEVNKLNTHLKYFKEINRCRTFFLTKIEQSKNSLSLIITESTLGKANNDYNNESEFELFFDSYIGFNVVDEGFACIDDYEIFEGNHLVIYQRSNYLDYIKKSTHANNENPGPFCHYGINCLSNIVDIVSIEPPEIRMIS